MCKTTYSDVYVGGYVCCEHTLIRTHNAHLIYFVALVVVSAVLFFTYVNTQCTSDSFCCIRISVIHFVVLVWGGFQREQQCTCRLFSLRYNKMNQMCIVCSRT